MNLKSFLRARLSVEHPCEQSSTGVIIRYYSQGYNLGILDTMTTFWCSYELKIQRSEERKISRYLLCYLLKRTLHWFQLTFIMMTALSDQMNNCWWSWKSPKPKRGNSDIKQCQIYGHFSCHKSPERKPTDVNVCCPCFTTDLFRTSLTSFRSEVSDFIVIIPHHT